MPCSMHDSWVALRSRIMDYLGQNTIADLAKALEQKKKALAASQAAQNQARGRETGLDPAPGIHRLGTAI